MPVVGFLGGRSSSDAAYVLVPFRQGLKEAGFNGEVDVVDPRYIAAGQHRLPNLRALLCRQAHAAARLALLSLTLLAGLALLTLLAGLTLLTPSGSPVRRNATYKLPGLIHFGLLTRRPRLPTLWGLLCEIRTQMGGCGLNSFGSTASRLSGSAAFALPVAAPSTSSIAIPTAS